MLQRQNINNQINSRFIPATDLKTGTFVLIPNFTTQKKVSRKLDSLRKGPYQLIDKALDVTYKLTDSSKKKLVQHRNNLLPVYPKEYALRKLTQLYSFKGLKIVQDNSEFKQNQNTDKHMNSKPTQQKDLVQVTSSKLDKNISKRKKNKKNDSKNPTTGSIENSEHREPSRLRSKP